MGQTFRKPSYSFSHLILITILQSRRCQRKAGSLCHEGEGQGLEQHGPLALGGQPRELRHLPHGPQRQLPGHAEWWLPAAAGPARLLLPRASHPQEARSTADTVGPCAPGAAGPRDEASAAHRPSSLWSGPTPAGALGGPVSAGQHPLGSDRDQRCACSGVLLIDFGCTGSLLLQPAFSPCCGLGWGGPPLQLCCSGYSLRWLLL